MQLVILRSNRNTFEESVPVGALSRDAEALSVEVADLSLKEEAVLRRDPRVLNYAPLMPTRIIPVEPNVDPGTSAPADVWGLKAVRAEASTFTGHGVTVAVLDTGIDQKHPAFHGKGIDVQTKNFTSEPEEDMDGHGTHCAGTIFGRPVNGCRIGVADGVSTVLIGKVLGLGGGTTDAIIKAILWAYEKNANVISMSLGIDFVGFQAHLAKSMPQQVATSQALAGYLANVRSFDRLSSWISGRNSMTAGAVLVAAAGNESRRDIHKDYRITVSPPAAGNEILSVGALGFRPNNLSCDYFVAPFSNTAARLSAPGVSILSAQRGGGLVTLSGTSMAAAHVSGVAALWTEKLMSGGRPFQSSSAIDWILRSVVPMPYLDPEDVGLGMVQAP